MTRLNDAARETLHAAGLTSKRWAQLHGSDDGWHGDRCGCPDDRCIGYHHDETEKCPCLAVLVGEV